MKGGCEGGKTDLGEIIDVKCAGYEGAKEGPIFTIVCCCGGGCTNVCKLFAVVAAAAPMCAISDVFNLFAAFRLTGAFNANISSWDVSSVQEMEHSKRVVGSSDVCEACGNVHWNIEC